MPSPTPRTYRQSLGFLQLVWLGVGGTIGSGIFVAPGTAARLAGESALLAWGLVALVACSVAFALGSLQSAMLRSQAEAPGGTAFIDLFTGTFGRRGAALLVVCYVSGSIFGVATVAAGLGQYLDWFGVPHLVAVEAALILVMLGVNLWGIGLSGSTETLLSVLKIAGMLAIIAVLLPLLQIDAVTPRTMAPLPVLLQVAIIVFWPFTGFEISAIPAGETRNPRLIAPALLTVMVLVCVIYLGLNLALLGAVGAPALGASGAPVADAVARVLPGSGPWVAILAIVTMLSALNAYIVGASRSLHDVLQRHGSTGRVWAGAAQLSVRGVPTAALLVTCLGAAALLQFSNRFDDLAAIAVVLTLVPYVALCWAAQAAAETLAVKVVSLFGGLMTAGILVLYFTL